MVSEPERLKTLDDLYDVKNEIINALEHFPILNQVKRTNSTELGKQKLEEKLLRVHKAIGIYERPPVYIAI